MKKTIITLALALTLCASAALTSCGGNTATGGNADGNGTTSGTTQATETDKNIIDDAESMIEDASERATHGYDDGTPGGNSARDFGPRDRMFPRGK